MRQDPGHPGRSRRQFLRDTALAGVATMSGLVGVPASAGAAPSGPRVAVLGGGVAGLSAALELAERNFRVTVYERKALGGKARSIPVPQSATGGRRSLPGEHGFRVFPGFYWNLGDTMRRIPFAGNQQAMSPDYRRLVAHGATQNLVATKAREASAHTVGLVSEAIIWS